MDTIINKPQITVKVKVNFALRQAMKAQRVSRGISVLFLYLGDRCG
jgi:hypothetical protein